MLEGPGARGRGSGTPRLLSVVRLRMRPRAPVFFICQMGCCEDRMRSWLVQELTHSTNIYPAPATCQMLFLLCRI